MFRKKKKDSPTKEQEVKKDLEKVEEVQNPQEQEESLKNTQNQVDQQQGNNSGFKKPDSERNSARDKSKSRVMGGILEEIDKELLEGNNEANYGFDMEKREENMEELPPVEEDQVPEYKDEMIEYLMNKLSRAEMAISHMYMEIELEKQRRDNMRNEIGEKKERIDQEQDTDNTAFRERVEAKMTVAIEQAINDRIKAEEEKAELENELALLDEEFMKIDLEIRDVHREKCNKEFLADEAQYRINEQEMIIDDYNAHVERLTDINNKKQVEIEGYTYEIDDMKAVVETLIGVRAKLNHYIPDGHLHYTDPKRKVWLEDDIDIFATQNRSVLRSHISNGQDNLFEGSQKTQKGAEEEDFWYKGAEVYKKNNAENLKPSNYSTYPWQPKVQKTNSPAEMDRSDVYKIGYVETKSLSQSKLPTINRNDKQEHLFKNKEFIDEFGPLKTKIVKGKITVPRVKTRHGA